MGMELRADHILGFLLILLIVTSGCVSRESEHVPIPTQPPVETITPSSIPSKQPGPPSIKQEWSEKWGPRNKELGLEGCGKFKDQQGLSGGCHSGSGSPLFFSKRGTRSPRYFSKSIRECHGNRLPYERKPLPPLSLLNGHEIVISEIHLNNTERTPMLSFSIDGSPSRFFFPETPKEYLKYLAACIIEEMDYRKNGPTLLLENGTHVSMWAVPPISNVTGITEEEYPIFIERMNAIEDWARHSDVDDEFLINSPRAIGRGLEIESYLDYPREIEATVYFTDAGIFERDWVERKKKEWEEENGKLPGRIQLIKPRCREDYRREIIKLNDTVKGFLVYPSCKTLELKVWGHPGKLIEIGRLPFVRDIKPERCISTGFEDDIPDDDFFHCHRSKNYE